jgi:uncharacterized protein YggU (UPF0235/DUF167 family)
MLTTWCEYDPTQSRLRLSIQARPNAKKTAAAGIFDMSLKVHIAAPAIDDLANIALIEWLAKQLQIPKRAIHIKSGTNAKYKRIEVATANDDTYALALTLATNARN